MLWCVSSPHARKRSAKEAPAAPLPGARQKASSLQPGTDPAADAQGCPCPAQTQPDGRSPAQGRAGGVQGNAAQSIAWGLPPARQPRPARKSPRRAAPPAQRGTRRRGRANPARWTKPGTGPGWWCAASAAGHSRRARRQSGTREGRASGCPDRYHLRPRAQRVQVVRPRLQHRPALLEELRPVVGTPQRIRHSMG